jgi:hypothetical protein
LKEENRVDKASKVSERIKKILGEQKKTKRMELLSVRQARHTKSQTWTI